MQPDLIIGDLDIINPNLRTSLNTVYLPDQNYCDFSKAVAHLIKAMKLLPSIMTGITGKAADYVLQNINIFLDTDSIFYTHSLPVVGYTLQKGITHFSLPRNTKISLLGITKAQISTKGLRWELHLSDPAFPGKNSCFNLSLNSKISVEVVSGVCWQWFI
nr:thiamine diphosphokinase [Wolbachia endosymbiont of Wuchereria bancrofti]